MCLGSLFHDTVDTNLIMNISCVKGCFEEVIDLVVIGG